MIQRPKYGRPDTPLAETPKPKFMDGLTINQNTIHTGSAKTDPGVLKAQANKAKRDVVAKNYSKKVASGVVISKKDEAAHPEDFKFLKKK